MHKSRIASYLICWVAWTVGLLSAYSQNLKFDFDEYSIVNGLSHNQVQAIAQDKRGFMWFGTAHGLNRFDGYNFRQYKHLEGDSTSLISNEVRTILAEEDGSLLIGTNLGVCRYIPETDNFIRYTIDYVDNSKLHGNYVTSMQRRNDGSVWITYLGSGIDVIYPDSSFVLHFTMYRDDRFILKNDMLTALQFMPDGNILLGGKEGIQAINSKMEVISDAQVERLFPWKNQLPDSYTCLYLMRNNKTLWVGTEANGIFKIDITTNTIRKFNTSNSELDSDNIECIFESSDRIWIGTSAPFVYDVDEDQVKWYNKKGMYVKNRINVFFEDSGKNLWMGTTRVGVRKINYDETEMLHFHSNQGEGSIKSDEVLAFHEDSFKNIWISLGGFGLYQYQGQDDDYVFAESGINDKLISKSVKSIHEDANHILWLGSWEGGLTRFDPKSKSIIRFHPAFKNFPSQHVWDIETASGDDIWVGTLRDGIYLFSTSTHTFQSFRHSDSDSSSIINNDVLCLLKDPADNLWIGTGNGLSIKFTDRPGFENYFLIDSPLMKNLISNVIHCMYRDKLNRVWLGTNGSGVIIARLNEKKLSIERILTTKDGLTSNAIHAFQPDGTGKVWVTTNNGLSILDEEQLLAEKISENQSFTGTEFLTNSSWLTLSGRLLLGSTSGFYVLSPQNKKINTTKPPVYIIDLKLLNKTITLSDPNSILSDPIELTREIVIPYGINYYSFEFVALNYTQIERNQYAYWLEGFDSDWNPAGTQRTVSFTNLNPGNYTLHVKASNNDNLWNEEGASLKVTILPPWWKTTWFRALAFFSLAGLIILAFQIRTTSIRGLNRRLERQVAERTSELSMMNSELQLSKEEIAAQNEELLEKQEEISSQRDFVENQNQEILRKSQELEESHHKLQNQNKELEKLHEEKDGMINIIAHDLKSPLKQIQGLADLVKISGPVNEAQEKYLGLVKGVVSHGSTLINNLLELHGIESTNVKEELVEINLSDFIPVWLQGYQPTLNSKKQKTDVRIETGIKALTVNWDYLQRALDNLLTNAMKFSHEGSTIYIDVSQQVGTIRISIRDEGPGIAQEERKELFKPFKKLSARPTGGESSTGLGLSIVKLLTDKMSGTLEVSGKPGKGSTFSIILPLTKT